MKEITLKEAKEVIELYQNVDNFIDSHFRQWLSGHNEYNDNSMDLANYYHKCEKILNEEKSRSDSEGK